MSNAAEKTDTFLKKIGMHPDQTDIGETVSLILEDMKKGLLGEPSSLPMIPTYVSADIVPRDNEPVIVVDAGGTNLRVGLCEFRGGAPITLKSEKLPIPGSRGVLTSDEFFGQIADRLLPFAEKSRRIGFCFSYPAEILPDHDGRILQMGKEVRVTGCEGAVIGAELKKQLAAKGESGDYCFSLLNDTTAGLLGAVSTLGLKTEGGLAGLVVGTGINACYFERGGNIRKLSRADDMIINCEMGMFSGVKQGKADALVDEASELPGDHRLEKMIAGAYLGTVITRCCELAAKEGLLSPRFAAIEQSFYLPELDELVRDGSNRVSDMCAKGDREVLVRLTELLFERAAKLICAVIAALLLHTDGGKCREHPFSVAAEGSTIHNSLLMAEKLRMYTDSYISGELGRFVEFFHAENSTLAGAALSVFTSPGKSGIIRNCNICGEVRL